MFDDVEQKILETLTKATYLLLKGDVPEIIILPEGYPENELSQFVEYFNRLILEINETTTFTLALSKGDLNLDSNKSRLLINSAVMNLHMGLKHLTWKTKQIANGDLDQRVDFMGEFSDAFNSMTQQLKISFDEIKKKKTELRNVNKTLEFERNNLENIVYTRTLELQEALQRKDLFLKNVSHELRTPLNAIIGFTEILIDIYNQNLDKQQLEYLGIVKDSGNHLLELVNNLLDLIVYQSAIEKLPKEALNISDVISEAAEFMESQSTEKSINIITICNEDLDTIIYNKKALKQILINLISNAIKYSSENSDVIIKVEKIDDEYGKISVIDQASGVSEDDKTKIFDGFYKSEMARINAIEGLGVGLTICKNLVEMHGGNISVENNQPCGSIFWFTFLINQATG